MYIIWHEIDIIEFLLKGTNIVEITYGQVWMWEVKLKYTVSS
jgi:hypothetical protein